MKERVASGSLQVRVGDEAFWGWSSGTGQSGLALCSSSAVEGLAGVASCGFVRRGAGPLLEPPEALAVLSGSQRGPSPPTSTIV